MDPMQFDSIRNPHLEKVAAELYSDEMPYHNFIHVLGALAAGEILVDRCLSEGVPINAKVVYYALLFHDAGYHEDHISKGFTSKEEYSVHLAVQCLRAEAIPEDTIERVVAAILSTQRDAKFTSNEDKAVRAADLAGLASDYKTFRSNAEKLRQEEETLTGRKVAWDEWKTAVKETIEFYLSQEIRFTHSDACADHSASFHTRAKQNLLRLLSED
jgi:predicted metal-dependent HD superfamily phosphohydrolase